MSNSKLTTSSNLTPEPVSAIGSDDLVDRIAKEIGKSVAEHIESMYPEATKAVAWKSCSRSIEGVVRNAVKEAGKAAEKGEADLWINRSRLMRLERARWMKRART